MELELYSADKDTDHRVTNSDPVFRVWCALLLQVLIGVERKGATENEQERSNRLKHCALAVVRRSQKISLAADPLPGGTGRPKFNQLETVTTFTYKPSLVKIDARNFELSWQQTPTHRHTNPQTGPITIHCAAKLSAQGNYHDLGRI